ncbi:8862_t:CDS:2, partial [Cetraspora pellucida]
LGLQFDEQSDLTNQFDSVEQLEQSNSNEKKVAQKRNKSQQEDEDEISNSSSSDKDFIAIENPIMHSKRGAPRK